LPPISTASTIAAATTFAAPGIGFTNLGNTCYFNSALQVLLRTDLFTNFWQAHDPTTTCELWGRSRESCLPCTLHRLRHFPTHTIYHSESLFQVFQQPDPDLPWMPAWPDHTVQCDANECLMRITRLLRKYPSDQVRYETHLDAHIHQTTHCLTCGTLDHTRSYDTSFSQFDLYLPFTERETEQIAEPLTLTATGLDDGSSAPLVPIEYLTWNILNQRTTEVGPLPCHCDPLVAHWVRDRRLLVAPPVLVVQLVRHRLLPDGRAYKTHYPVVFGSELDLANLAFAAPVVDLRVHLPNRIYDLYGIILHQGPSLHHGHYIALVKDDTQWLICDDTEVRPYPVDFNDSQLQQSAYILYYKQRATPPASSYPVDPDHSDLDTDSASSDTDSYMDLTP
jgi:hypothetical protein